jgi:hypothetical protein
MVVHFLVVQFPASLQSVALTSGGVVKSVSVMAVASREAALVCSVIIVSCMPQWVVGLLFRFA